MRFVLRRCKRRWSSRVLARSVRILAAGPAKGNGEAQVVSDMDSIAVLEDRISEVEQLIAINDRSTEAARLSAVSLENHLDELRGQLRIEKQRRMYEVVELHLAGYAARDGSLPLPLLGKLAQHLSDGLHGVARFLYSGKQSGRVPRQIVETLNLRLSAIGTGSTRLIIAGDTSPDLFGRSLIEEGLTSTFQLLQSDSPDTLMAAVAKVGTKSAMALRSVLATLADNRLNVEMLWTTPTNQEVRFHGSPTTMRDLAVSLGGFEPGGDTPVRVSGEIVTLSSRELFEMRSGTGELIRATVPGELLARIKTLHVGQDIDARLRRTTVVNRITQAEKATLTLEEVTPHHESRSEPGLPF
jgi:hypothetical protein